MKKSTLFKFALAIPALAFALASCSENENPLFIGQINAIAIQKEVKAGDGTVNMKFVPNITAQAISDVDVINPKLYSSAISFFDDFSPYAGHVESKIETNEKTTLEALNGVYDFKAGNARGERLELWVRWQFAESQKFSRGWGEFEENATDRNIETFSYTNGKIELKFKAFTTAQAGVSSTEVEYFMIIMGEFDVAIDEACQVRDWVGAPSGGTRWSLEIVDGKGHAILPGFSDARYDGKKVYLAAVKNCSDATYNQKLMLLSSPKTINIQRPVFVEDEIPVIPLP